MSVEHRTKNELDIVVCSSLAWGSVCKSMCSSKFTTHVHMSDHVCTDVSMCAWVLVHRCMHVYMHLCLSNHTCFWRLGSPMSRSRVASPRATCPLLIGRMRTFRLASLPRCKLLDFCVLKHSLIPLASYHQAQHAHWL